MNPENKKSQISSTARGVYSDDRASENIKEKGRLLGLDIGRKIIGIAVSDWEQRLANPLTRLERRKFTKDIVLLSKIVEQQQACGIIVGLPLNMDGTEGPQTQSIQAFVREGTPYISVPILFWDERLSTVAMTRHLIDKDVSRARREKIIDQMAAAYILQGALDYFSSFRRRQREVSVS